jgi:hypothetical protein
MPDRAGFFGRAAALVAGGVLTMSAWALLPTHAHLLGRTRGRPLARALRSLLTGYAGAFNRRHQRAGHLFQHRSQPVVVEEAPDLLELVRYLHLNPLRTGLVPNLRTLARSPWTGHSALLGTLPRPWQESQPILSQRGSARRRAQARVPDRRGREAYAADDRVLGTAAFVARLRARVRAPAEAAPWCRRAGQSGRRLAATLGLSPEPGGFTKKP